MPQSNNAYSFGNIKKKTTVRNGKEYVVWEVRISMGYDPITGKQIQKSVSAKTQKEVREKLKKVLTELENDTYIEPCKMTVGEWLDIWAKEYLNNIKILTKENYLHQISKHLKPGIGQIKLECLNTLTIQRLYNSLQTEKGLSAKTIKNIHGVLHMALSQAVDSGYIRKNPSDACKLPKINKSEIVALEPEQMSTLLQKAQEDSYNNLFITALFTGMRQSELIGLSWDCVNMETGVITVKQQLQCKDGEYFISTPKNGKPRVVVPAPLVMEALHQEKAKQDSYRMAAGSLWSNPHNLVFTDSLGKNLVRRTVVKHFKKITERSGIDPAFRFHDLRHSYAVASLQAGDDIKTIQSNLGHATAAFTLQVYAHVNDSMRQESSARMQKYYESVIL